MLRRNGLTTSFYNIYGTHHFGPNWIKIVKSAEADPTLKLNEVLAESRAKKIESQNPWVRKSVNVKAIVLNLKKMVLRANDSLGISDDMLIADNNN